MPYLVQCNTCSASAVMDGAQMEHPDSHLNCDPDGPCCLQDHDHAAEANAGRVCRPLTITPLQGSATIVGVG